MLERTPPPADRVAEAAEPAQSTFQQILSVPNQLTMLRMLVVPFILISMIYEQHDMALGLFVLAALTDGIDGLVARHFNQKTLLGAYLDPIADKLFLSSAFFVQALIGAIPWWLAILVLSRDVIIIATVLVMVLATQMRDFPPSSFGKVNTGVQVATIFSILLNNSLQQAWTSQGSQILIWAVGTTTLMSAVHYSLEYSRRLHEYLTGSSNS